MATRLAAAAAAALIGLASPLAQAGEISVALSSASEGGYTVEASFLVPEASTAAAWSALSDYEGLESFVSSMKKSRVLSRQGAGALVEQVGTGKFMFFSRKIRVVLEIRETPGERIAFRDVDGKQFTAYEGEWRIEAGRPGAGAVVRYALRAQPRQGAPAFIERAALRRNVERMLYEVGREIERRSETGHD